MGDIPAIRLAEYLRLYSNGTVHYLGGYERKLAAGANPEAVTKYYSASFGAMSRLVAFRRAGTLHWVGSDHLGGTIRVLNSSFTALDWDALQALQLDIEFAKQMSWKAHPGPSSSSCPLANRSPTTRSAT